MTKRRKPMPTTCRHCGVEFLACQAKLERGEAKFCSKSCRYLGSGFIERVMALLPSTPSELSRLMKLPARSIGRVLSRAVSEERCHIVKYVRGPEARGNNHSPFELYYKPGPAPIVCSDLRMPREVQAALTLHAVLGAMPANQATLTETTGLSRCSVTLAVRELHATGRCHIVAWRRGVTGGPVPTYKAGNRRDAVCNIEKLTQKERTERFLKKARKSGRIKELRETWTRNVAASKARKNGDRLINALFGQPGNRLKQAA